jgi:propanol-preferring alcohol dehydrogenase
MKAFQFVEWQRPGQLRDVPVPEPGPGEVLIKVGGAGACHSDLHLLEAPPGSRSFVLPFTLGHENAGWVETLGPGATGFTPGDPVIVYGPWGCGLCMNCRGGLENYCQTPGKPSPGGLGQMAIQVLKALSGATTVVAVDTSEEKLKVAKNMGADEVLISGDEAVTRIKGITRGQGAELVLDLVGVTPTLSMAAQVARVLGHLTIVGVGSAALPVNFSSPPHECAVASPFWGSIPELIEVISLARTGKLKMLVEHFPLDRAAEAYELLHHGKIEGRAVITPSD